MYQTPTCSSLQVESYNRLWQILIPGAVKVEFRLSRAERRRPGAAYVRTCYTVCVALLSEPVAADSRYIA